MKFAAILVYLIGTVVILTVCAGTIYIIFYG